jgi:hypothetical protein
MKTRLQTNPQVLLISDLLNREPSKQELQRQMERTRESLAETVGEIKETLSQEVAPSRSLFPACLTMSDGHGRLSFFRFVVIVQKG